MTEAGGWYLVSVHESYVLQAGLGCFLLWHQHSQQSLLLLHLTFQPLDIPVHRLQAVSQLGQLLFLELHDGQPEGASNGKPSRGTSRGYMWLMLSDTTSLPFVWRFYTNCNHLTFGGKNAFIFITDVGLGFWNMASKIWKKKNPICRKVSTLVWGVFVSCEKVKKVKK